MSSKASRIPTAKDRLRKQSIDIRDLQAINRNRNTPRPVATTATAGSSAAGSTGGGTGNFLDIGGGTMVGPLALNPPVDFRVEISANGTIDISPQNLSLQYSSNIQLDDIQPNSTTLDTIAGAAFDGQLLIIRTFAPRPALTIAQATMANGGNIQTPDDDDFELGDLQMIELVFDEALLVFGNTGGTWRVLSTGGGGGEEAAIAILGLAADQLIDGVIDWDENFIFGDSSKIIDRTATNAGVFQLVGDVFNLDSFGSVEGDTGGQGSSFLIEWEESSSVSGPFTTIPNPQARFGVLNAGRAAFTTQPSAIAIVDARSADVFVRLVLVTVTGTLIAILNGTSGASIESVSSGGSGGGGTSGYDRIQDEGINVTQQATMNFIGSAVSAVNNAGQNRTDITITAGGTSLPVVDTTPIVFGSTDATKQMRFEIDGFTTGTTRVMTLPDADVTLAGLTVTDQTWTGTNNFFGLTNVLDTNFEIQNQVDNTKFINFNCAGATTGKQAVIVSNHTDDRVITLPDAATILGGLTVPTLQSWTGSNDFSGLVTLRDTFLISNITDITKQATFDVSQVSINTTRTYALPNGDGELLITPSQSDWDLNTFDVFNIDSLGFMATTGSLGVLNVGFSSLGNGGYRSNVLINQPVEWTEENVIKMKLSANSTFSTTSLELTGILGSTIALSETTTAKVAEIVKGTASLLIDDPDLLEFGNAGNTIFRVDSGGIQMGANSGDSKFIANVDQIGFRNLGNFIEDDINGLKFFCIPSDDFEWQDGTDIFGTFAFGALDLNSAYIGLNPITNPGAPASAGFGRIFEDSGNLNHLSIISDRGLVDLEAGGGGGSLVGTIEEALWTSHETTQYDFEVFHSNSNNYGADFTFTASEDILMYVPIFIAKTVTFAEMAIEIKAGSGIHVVGFGIYSNRTDGQNYPASLIVQGTGAIDIGQVGVKQLLLDDNTEVLVPGLYWLAYVDTTGNYNLKGYEPGNAQSVGWQRDGLNNGAMRPISGYVQGHVSQVLPNTPDDEMQTFADLLFDSTPALFARFT